MHDLRLFQSGSPIAAAWRRLAEHGDECDVCLPYLQRLVEAVNPQQTDFEVFDELCDAGKELFKVWRAAKDEWLEGTRTVRRRQFITDEQLRADRVSFETRSAAVMSMPTTEYKHWLALPDDRRHAQLLALESGLPETPRPSPIKICEGCGQGNYTGGRFHSRACRLKWEAEHGC